MTTTYQVKPNSDEWEVWERTQYYYDDRDCEQVQKEETNMVVFESRALADCAAFIQLRKAGHI